MSNGTRIKDDNRVLIEYSADPNWDYSTGYPSGEESVWKWEAEYNPTEHTFNGETVGPHKFSRIKVGALGTWSYPQPISGQSVSKVDFVYKEDLGNALSYNVVTTYEDGTTYTSATPIEVQKGEAGKDADGAGNTPAETWFNTETDMKAYTSYQDGVRYGIFANESVYIYRASSTVGIKPDNNSTAVGRYVFDYSFSGQFASTGDMSTNPMVQAAKAVTPYLLQYWWNLRNVADGAEVNVNADWSSTSGDSEILNKPTDVTDLSTHSVTELNDVNALAASQIVETDGSSHLISVAKNTAYNKAFGTTSGTVAEGDSIHWNSVDETVFGAAGVNQRLVPSNSATKTMFIENDDWGLTLLRLKNTNDSDNWAGSVIELKGSGADFQNSMFIGKYGAGYNLALLQDSGAVLSDKNLAIGTVGTSAQINFVRGGGSYNTPTAVGVWDSSGFKINTLSASQIVETDSNGYFISAAKGTAYNKNFGTTAGNVADGGTLQAHVSDSSIHFTEGSISHLNIGDIGTNTHAQIDAFISSKGQANGLVPLNGSSLIDAAYLPSYVDDVEEYANLASFPTTGETGKIYVALDTGFIYRWSGSTYIQLNTTDLSGYIPYTGASQDATLGTNSLTAYNLTATNNLYVNGSNGRAYLDPTSLRLGEQNSSATTRDIAFYSSGNSNADATIEVTGGSSTANQGNFYVKSGVLQTGRVSVGAAITPRGIVDILTGNTKTIDIPNQFAGSVIFGNNGTTEAIATISGKSSTNAGLTLLAATNNSNTAGDMIFDVRESDDTDFATTTSSAFKFRRYTTDLLTITRDGNVGIGQSPFSSKLEVLSAQQTLANGNIRGIASLSDTFSSGTYSAGVGFGLTNAASSGVVGTFESNDNNVMGLAFLVHSSPTVTDPLVEAMRIDSSGKVGVTNPSPFYGLDVNNTAGFAHGNGTGHRTAFENSNEINHYTSGTASQLSIQNNASATSSTRIGRGALVVGGNDGEVGVGTSATRAKLTIQGTATTTLGEHYYVGLGAVADQGVNTYHLIGLGVAPTNHYPTFVGYKETDNASNTKGDLIFGTRNVTTDTVADIRMTIESSGNVGIGSLAPATNLHVNQVDLGTSWAHTADAIAVTGADSRMALVSLSDGSYGSGVSLKEVNTSTNVFRNSWDITRTTGTAPLLQFRYGTNVNAELNTPRLEITSTGTVLMGIGTDSYSKLVVGGNVNINNYALIYNYSSSSNIDHIWFDESTNLFSFVADSSYKAAGNAGLACGPITTTTGAKITNPADATTASASSTFTVNFNEYKQYDLTLTATTTLNCSGGVAGDRRVLRVQGNGSYALNLGTGVGALNNKSYDGNVGGFLIVHCFTPNSQYYVETLDLPL